MSLLSRLSLLSFCLAVFALAAGAQNPAKWALESAAKGTSLKQDENFKAALKAEIEAGWHLYAPEQRPGGPVATTIRIAPGAPFDLTGTLESPKPLAKLDPNFNIETKYYEREAAFGLNVRANAAAPADDLAVDVRFQLCNDTLCLPPKTVRVTFAGAEDAKKSSAAGSSTQTASGGQVSANANPTAGRLSGSKEAVADGAANSGGADGSLLSFIWLAITLGALSLLTPCVFPMIPITVSYFTNHSGQSRARAVKLATVYSLGIVATFTLLGMLLAVFVGAAGINLFAASPWVNLVITAIFFFFAFNLFGAYEINVPSGILNRLDSLTRSREGEGGGIVGALLMGLTFTLTSFTCTSPFVGTILVTAARGEWQTPLLGMLAFSSVFALPFFALALAPQLALQLPRSGGWLNAVKVSMGFLEIAAAMKFLSNVDLVWRWGIFTRPVVLAVWIAIGVILAIYLLGKFQLFHDTKPERIGALRLLSAIVSLAVSFYLLTGLFGARLGELESFLPPDLENSAARFFGAKPESAKWLENDLQAAQAAAAAANKRVFIDFTGYTCTNCRWMEANVFPKKEVAAEMNKFVLARLYTDGEGETYERQQQFQEETFKTVALPFYAVVEPDGKIVTTFPGLTRDVGEFVDFLRKAQRN